MRIPLVRTQIFQSRVYDSPLEINIADMIYLYIIDFICATPSLNPKTFGNR